LIDVALPAKQILMLNIKAVRPELVTVLASVFLLLGFNLTLWQHLFAITDFDGKGLLLRGAFAVMIFCVFNIFLTLFAFKKVLKPVLIVLFMISAGVAYFMSQ
jgi:lipid A ethanolaminephosphotransferase